MNPFLLTPQERLADWKDFRKSLQGQPDDDALRRVAAYWSQAPILKRPVIDPEDSTDWPGPWEMISAGDWCNCSVALGMEFTLRLAGWDQERLTIQYIRDFDISDQFMIVKMDATKVLNYSYGIVTEYPNSDHLVIASWSFNGRFYAKKSG